MAYKTLMWPLTHSVPATVSDRRVPALGLLPVLLPLAQRQSHYSQISRTAHSSFRSLLSARFPLDHSVIFKLTMPIAPNPPLCILTLLLHTRLIHSSMFPY